MTVLGSLAQALARLDARRTTRISGNQIVTALPAADSIVLSDGRVQRLISYADAVAESPVVFAIWARIVQTLATTDIVVETKKDNGTWGPAADTSLEQLLREPAEGFGLVDVLQWFFNPYLVEGNGLVAKYRDHAKATPSALLPLDWRHVSAWATYGGPVELWSTTQTGQERGINPSEVVHLSWDAPTSGPIGLSPLRSLTTAVRVTVTRPAPGRLHPGGQKDRTRVGGLGVRPVDDLQGDAVFAIHQRRQPGPGGAKGLFRKPLGGDDDAHRPVALTHQREHAALQLGHARGIVDPHHHLYLLRGLLGFGYHRASANVN